jgi:multiple antibiotic resistance protein
MVSEFFSLLIISLPAVFFVVDPLAAVPIFLSMTAGDSPQKIRKMAARACLVGCGILLFFAIFGGLVFKVFGVTLGAFRVAGGILLLMTSLDMLRARRSETRTSLKETREGTSKEDVAVVPLAMPLLAGPGSIATVMVLMSKGTGVLSAIPVLISIVVTFAASYLILRAAGLVQRILKQTGIAILERLMGLILAAIAVQFIAEGSRDLFRAG